MIYAHLTVPYILFDKDELLCWTGTHSSEKSIFVDFWCSISCLLQTYFSMLSLFSTWWSLLYHTRCMCPWRCAEAGSLASRLQ